VIRTTALALWLVLAAAAPAFAQSRPTEDAAIRRSVAAFESAINQRDGRAVAGLFTRDGDVIFFDSPRVVGVTRWRKP
jgi:ketosteroid isomerase-like protein